MGKGVYAAENIEEGTTILIAEEKWFLTYQNLCQHSFFSKLENETSDKMAEFAYYLAYLSLLHRTTEEDAYAKAYVDHLPQNFNNLVCWQEEELEMLANRDLALRISNKREGIRKTFKTMQQILQR